MIEERAVKEAMASREVTSVVLSNQYRSMQIGGRRATCSDLNAWNSSNYWFNRGNEPTWMM